MRESTAKDRFIYRFGRFQVDARENLLSANGEIVSLSPKVFETLLLLVQNNGRMLSKDEIMETVWADSFVEETNLTSNISRLRKILHEDGERYIETYPKRGYRFRAEVETIRGETEVILKRRVTARVTQVVQEFGEGFAPLAYAAALSSVPNNLTLPGTPIIGREKELDVVDELIRQSRLVTLTGIGGTGKTRLALEAAGRSLSVFPDGVFFVALAAVTDADLVTSEIARTLGVKETSGRDLLDGLVDLLLDKHLLLVVDNFEQVMPASPVMQKLLNAAPGLKVLVTSRAQLHLAAEREFVVPPLDLPVGSDARLKFNELAENESIKLFLERARAIKPSFVLTDENATIVGEICCQVDGLPLAIELAAARIRILSAAQILERLDQRLKLLTGGSKDLPIRQQTMRGAIAWSYDLLPEEERELFRRLAVFAGGFSIEAAEAVVAAPDRDLLNGITSLVENSLLVQAAVADGASRFHLLEVVRAYASELLDTSGDGYAVRKNHLTFFSSRARIAEPEMFTEQGGAWLERLEDDHDNLRAALEWSLRHDLDTAVGLAAALRNFWVLHNHLSEGRRWLDLTVAACGDAGAAEDRIKLFNGLGHTAGYQGDLGAARTAHEMGLTEARQADDQRQIARSIRGLGFVSKAQGDVVAAREYYREALALSRELDEKNGLAVSLTALGDLARMESDHESARPYYEEALSICRSTGNEQGVVGCLNNLGATAYGEGDDSASRRYYQQGLTAVLKLSDKISLSYSLDGFAALALRSGELVRSAQLAGAAEHLRETLGFETEPAERRFREIYLEQLSDLMEATQLASAFKRGRTLKLDEVVRLACAT
ncbi:MAG: tetratricopeptide repeat protein [Pyrinomonadaceae bacterium]